MTIVYEVPTSPESQLFTIQLGSQSYQLRLLWNQTAACWILDIADAEGNPLVQGIPVVTGLDLLRQYKTLGIEGSLIAQTDYDSSAVPTYENLGSTGRIYFVVEP